MTSDWCGWDLHHCQNGSHRTSSSSLSRRAGWWWLLWEWEAFPGRPHAALRKHRPALWCRPHRFGDSVWIVLWFCGHKLLQKSIRIHLRMGRLSCKTSWRTTANWTLLWSCSCYIVDLDGGRLSGDAVRPLGIMFRAFINPAVRRSVLHQRRQLRSRRLLAGWCCPFVQTLMIFRF